MWSRTSKNRLDKLLSRRERKRERKGLSLEQKSQKKFKLLIKSTSKEIVFKFLSEVKRKIEYQSQSRGVKDLTPRATTRFPEKMAIGLVRFSKEIHKTLN